ncbi:MAG: SMC-Scp complex subunit ScpB [Brevinema sp.]
MRTLFLNKTYSKNEITGLIESVLYVYGRPVDKSRLCDWFSVSEGEVDAIISELNSSYEGRHSGLRIILVANGYQMATNPLFKEEMRELFGSKDENRLSDTIMEILAIVAYKQPITKEEIDKIRGVNSSRSLNSLLGLKLVDIVGSDELLEEPQYGTTKRFLEVFRLKSLRDLPSPENLDFSVLDATEVSENQGDPLFEIEK